MSKRPSGFTLIEVLIAVLVLAIGLLGLAKLQIFGLHNNHSANLRTQATLLAYDMADRIRANRRAYLDSSGNYIAPPTGTTSKQCEWYDSTVADCTPTEMAQFDLANWQTAIGEGLPGGTGTVCLDSTPEDGDPSGDACDGSGNVYAIKIWWIDEFDANGNPIIKRFVTTFQP